MTAEHPFDSVTRRHFLAGAAGLGAAGMLASVAGSANTQQEAQPLTPTRRQPRQRPRSATDDVPFDYQLPYPSQRAPVMARNCVATSQPLAAQAGLEVMRQGGNAMDAAVATAATLTVVEPVSNGLGSDNFAIIRTADGKIHGLNSSGRAAKGLKRSDYTDRIPTRGWEGVTTPGAVNGWAEVNKKFGALPLTKVLEPAIRYAREGFPVSPGIAGSWRGGVRSMRGDERYDAFQQTFQLKGSGPRAGEIARLPDHADTLQRIAETMGRDFYEGDIARKLDADARKFGGALRYEDMAAHVSDWVDTISVDYRGYRLHEIPPNGQGLAALMMLGILRNFDIADMGPDSVEATHLQIESMKLAFADAHRYIADPAHMDVKVEDLLDEGYLQSRAALIDPSRAKDFKHGEPKYGGTVLLTTADAQGNMVSFIQSNYSGFGSGMVVTGTGVALQNRGCCFTLEKGHPNEIGPGKRPYHTIIPAFLEKPNGLPAMAFGVMGGFMQPQGHSQVVARMVDFGQNPQAVLDAPRWQVGRSGLGVSVEPGHDDALYSDLADMGHEVRRSRRGASFGRGQIIWRLEEDGAYIAGSDLRADGQAVGF